MSRTWVLTNSRKALFTIVEISKGCIYEILNKDGLRFATIEKSTAGWSVNLGMQKYVDLDGLHSLLSEFLRREGVDKNRNNVEGGVENEKAKSS